MKGKILLGLTAILMLTGAAVGKGSNLSEI